MKSRAHLFALWTISALAVSFLMIKGRDSSSAAGKGTALFAGDPGTIMIKVTGVEGKAGVYRLPKGADLRSVIEMTLSEFPEKCFMKTESRRLLKNGDWVILDESRPECSGISVKMMTARERMLLGIPLDLSSMTKLDWEMLPGIGPTIARRIEEDRQINGDFATLKDLERIKGIGEKTVGKIEKYFKNDVSD